ncbi:MAG: ATP-binding protein, partial [Clostridiaceae bacterium]
SLVKSLVEMHGGTISAESKYGEGTKFIIKLPVRVLLDHDNSELETKLPNPSIDNYAEKMKIEFSDIYKLGNH